MIYQVNFEEIFPNALIFYFYALLLWLKKTNFYIIDYWGHRIVTVLAKIDRVFKIDFIALNESKRIQLQFATNIIKSAH